MKGKRLFAVLLVLALSFSMLLAGCGNKEEGASPNASPAASVEPSKPAEPQKLRMNAGSEPPQLNSILSTDVLSFNIFRSMMEGLTRLDQNSKPTPGIAEKWDVSTDGLVYTFHLRDAKWSNGDPVTAKDFEFAWKTVLKPETAAQYSYIMYAIKGAEAYNLGKGKIEDLGIKVIDDKTLEVTLAAPSPFFLSLCAFGTYLPVNEKFYLAQENGKTYGTEAEKILYCGPYTMTSWKHEDSLVLTKNQNYYDPNAVKLDEITMFMVKDANAALNMYNAGDLDMVGLKGEQVALVKNNNEEPKSYSDGSSWYFEFNMKDKIMKNVNIRKALTYALDRGSFVKNVLKNSSLPALSFVSPDIQGLNDKFRKEVPEYFQDNNSAEAKTLLQKGMQELGLTTMPKISLLTDDGDVSKRDGAAYQEYWKKNLGLDVEVKTVPFKVRLDLLSKHDFQVAIAGWGPDYNDPMTFLDMFTTGNGNNHTLYADAAYDKLVADARKEADQAKRMDLLKQMEKKLMDEMPVGPIYFRYRDYVTKPYVKGVVRNPFQDVDLFWASIEK